MSTFAHKSTSPDTSSTLRPYFFFPKFPRSPIANGSAALGLRALADGPFDAPVGLLDSIPNGSFGATVGALPALAIVFGAAGFGLLAADTMTLPFGAVEDTSLLGVLEGFVTADGGFEAAPLVAERAAGAPDVGGFFDAGVEALAAGFAYGSLYGAGSAFGAPPAAGSAFFAPAVEGTAFCAVCGLGPADFTPVLPCTGPSAAIEPWIF
jgi:hypothetical protein